jgi:hypothetical protein
MLYGASELVMAASNFRRSRISLRLFIPEDGVMAPKVLAVYLNFAHALGRLKIYILAP